MNSSNSSSGSSIDAEEPLNSAGEKPKGNEQGVRTTMSLLDGIQDFDIEPRPDQLKLL